MVSAVVACGTVSVVDSDHDIERVVEAIKAGWGFNLVYRQLQPRSCATESGQGWSYDTGDRRGECTDRYSRGVAFAITHELDSGAFELGKITSLCSRSTCASGVMRTVRPARTTRGIPACRDSALICGSRPEPG
jgi:hypothetical protein